MLWVKIAEDYSCLSFYKDVAIKNYLDEGITSKMLHLKTSFPTAMVELYHRLSKSKVYKSIIYRWKSRLLWARYSFHNKSIHNKYFWHYARVRATAYNIINSSKNYEIVGMPVRKEILNLYKENYKFPKKNNKINILILGGSLGSLILSKKLSKQICKLPIKIKKRLNVAHQSKVEDIKDIKSNYKLENIKFEVRAYFYNIHKKLKQSTLVICRAGASTISENLIAGIPAIYIPLHNSVGAHQFFNAQMIKNNKAGWLIKENEIIKPKFISLLSSLLSSNEPLEEASKNCKKIAKPQAQENLYRLVTGELYEKL